MARKKSDRPAITVREFTADDWPIIESLFGPKGACGGCWCMTWRVEKGGKTWTGRTGDQNRREFKKLATSGKVFGCLAFCGDEPVGWCNIGPRGDFPRLERVKALKSQWTDRTWSVTCFFIRPGWRGQSVGTALLKQAVKIAKAHGAKELEGYPVKLTQGPDMKMPAAFAWTGVPKLFERNDFVGITLPGQIRAIYSRSFKR